MTQKAIKALAATHAAQDVTSADMIQYNEIKRREGFFDIISTSHGKNGFNGALLRGHNTGTLYTITGRTLALFIFM